MQAFPSMRRSIVSRPEPFLKFERLLETYLAFAPRGFSSFRMAIPLWLREKLFQKNMLRAELRQLDSSVDAFEKLRFAEHHLSHAASAFFPSPFQEAAVLTLDGVGEWATAALAIGSGNRLEIVKELHFPHSLGLLYSAFTYYIGFKVNSGEYKVMGLAPYGKPRFAQKILDNIIELKPDGSFWLDQSYFDYCTGLTMTNARFAERDRGQKSVSGGRRRPQLRRQRSGAARRRLREYLDPAGSGGRRGSARRCAHRLSHAGGSSAQRDAGTRHHARRLSGAWFRASGDRAPAVGCRRPVRGLVRRCLNRGDGSGPGRRQSGRMDAGKDGVRPAGARCSFNPG